MSGPSRVLLPAVLVAAAGAALAGCAEGSLSVAGGSEGAVDGGRRDALGVGGDAATMDGGGGADGGAGRDTGGPVPGEFLAECRSGQDCRSGFCIQYGDRYVCTRHCGRAECPKGWGCKTVSRTGPDVDLICVPNLDTLCRPCTNNTDCGQFGDMCIELHGRKVCGRDCSAGQECPRFYGCAVVHDQAGVEGLQCIPESGQCSCTPEEDGQSRPCVRENEHGTCEGVEVCNGDDGWTNCTAPIPRPEECDGVDNDCDNLVDEDQDPRECAGPPSPVGQCTGTARCQGPAGWVCDAPMAERERCDGLDNDCNGVVDDGLCFDGNPCTDDVCDPETGCAFPPKAGPCDDQNPCTVNDHCSGGACVGTERSCDDGNPCTSDSCDRTSGQCVYADADGTPCETGNLCTADVCRRGRCTVGPESCPPPTPCLSYACDPARGCIPQPRNGNLCDDGDVCTVMDRCSNGECIPGRPACEGRSCDNCQADWASLNGWCVDLFDTPQCLCICF